ncbi:L-seryl-tRNA(Sec) selenium transferase [Acidobacteriota bacterium]
MTENLLRKIPSLDKIKGMETAQKMIELHSDSLFVESAREVLDTIRGEIKSGSVVHDDSSLTPEAILTRIGSFLEAKFLPSLQQAINATGVILHTGLGRAALPPVAQKAIAQVADGYSTLATDVDSGKRSHRDVHLNDLLCELTGAEAATVVNNNAAATMLILNTLAQGKECIVSRGQLVEIGGSFRMPDVMAASGTVLQEVGTTNKTHLRDYLAAAGEESSAIMRVHHSNYRIVGFTSEPGIEEIVELAKKLDLYVIDDLGSGALVDLAQYGIEHEPLVQDSIQAGVDVACFSGDKLIGGPQAGIIVGKKAIIERIRKNPLARALRIGKLTIAAMEATLRLFLKPEKLTEEHPVYRMFSMTVEEIEKRTKKMAKPLKAQLAENVDISLIDGGSQVGSGAVPVQTIPTKLLQITPKGSNVEDKAKELRGFKPPVFTRIHKGALLLDLRTVEEGKDRIVESALLEVFSE